MNVWLLACQSFLIVQNLFINEVESKTDDQSVRGWITSIENKYDVQEEYRSPKSLVDSEDLTYSEFLKKVNLNDKKIRVEDIISSNEYNALTEAEQLSIPVQEVKYQDLDEIEAPQKKKTKKLKKRGSKNKNKKDSPTSGRKFKKYYRKKQVHVNKANFSESNESLRKDKPVDIVVHIKMNDYNNYR